MEEFDFNKGKLRQLQTLKGLLSEGTKYFPDLNVYFGKIDSIETAIKNREISIVLLGSFSDGKTSAIAGMLGRLEDNMKIDNDESSDELTVYRPAGLKEGFKIVDTPGLFGTKEKEIDGRQVKFSQITERYISEAHILIYVCDAVVPLKDSHVEVLRKILRDYHKLDNTIFVINKMDEAGFDLLDDADFSNGCRIKKENLIDRLRRTINLTHDEEKRLNVVCIAADPKGKGLNHWFSKMDDYYNRSHINDLKQSVSAVVERTDSAELMKSTAVTSIVSVIDDLKELIDQSTKPISRAIARIDKDLPELQEDQRQLERELKQSKKELHEAIYNIKNDALREINGASLETIGEVISEQLGETDGKVSFYVFMDRLASQMEQCCETNTSSIEVASVNLGKSYEIQEKMLGDAVKYGAEQLKNLKISGDQVKAVRDVLAKSYKFKPWGAVNLGKNLTKWAGWAGAAISGAFEIYRWCKSYNDAKKLKQLKQELCNAVNDVVADSLKTLESDDIYYKNYAPSYLMLCDRVKERNAEVENLRREVNELEVYKNHIDDWMRTSKVGE